MQDWLGAPTRTSPNPSPFTSPALETECPNNGLSSPFDALTEAVHEGVGLSPDLDPWKTKTRPMSSPSPLS